MIGLTVRTAAFMSGMSARLPSTTGQIAYNRAHWEYLMPFSHIVRSVVTLEIVVTAEEVFVIV